MHLKSNHEIVGTLVAVAREGGRCVLKFSCTKDIELLSTALPQKKLLSLVGKRVGIFCCDGQFFLRVIKGK